MGYVRERKTYRLVWDEGDLEGLEVVAMSASVAGYRQIADLATHQFSWPPTAEDLVKVDELHESFGTLLVSWNLEQPKLDEHGREATDADGNRLLIAVPPTTEGLRSQDPQFTLAVILAWMSAVAGVPDPAAKEEDDLGDLLESIPMDVLTP